LIFGDISTDEGVFVYPGEISLKMGWQLFVKFDNLPTRKGRPIAVKGIFGTVAKIVEKYRRSIGVDRRLITMTEPI